MAKKPNIRISKRDKKEYQRLRKNTKAKINRVKKNYGIDLENEINLPSLEDFQTRQEFNIWKEKQKSFTNISNTEYQFMKNDYNVVASKKEVNEIKRNVKKAQRLADKKIKERENTPIYHKGEQVSTVKETSKLMKESDITGIHRPRDFNFKEIRSNRTLKTIKDSMKKRKNPRYYDERNKTMLDNFIKNMEGHFGSEADDFVKLLKTINPDDFLGIYMSNMFTFDFNLWDSEGNMQVTADDMQGQIEAMDRIVRDYKDSDYNR